MVVIDTVYINSSGGNTLLSLLLKEIVSHDIKYTFLIDERLPIENINKNINFIYLKGSEVARLKFYLKNKKNLSRVLCFSNVPPPVKLSCPVITYFHNVLIYNKNIQNFLTIRSRILLKIKGAYIKARRRNTNGWIVQTEPTKLLLMGSLRLNDDKIKVFPFYENQIHSNKKTNKIKDFFYPAIGEPHKNHNLLFKVWKNIYAEGKFKPVLHVTIDNRDYPKLNKRIIQLQNLGVKIINHGYITRKETQKLYNSCRFVIHPSIGESFGLVLIEAIINGNVILAPNLPYVKAIVQPNYFFDLNIESIKSSVINAFTEKAFPPSKILVNNEIKAFLNYFLKIK